MTPHKVDFVVILLLGLWNFPLCWKYFWFKTIVRMIVISLQISVVCIVFYESYVVMLEVLLTGILMY
jgi:hypothetical protein